MGEKKLQLNKLCIILELETNMPIEDAGDARMITMDMLRTIDPQHFQDVKWVSCFGYGGEKDVFGNQIINEKEEIYSDTTKNKVIIFRNCKPQFDNLFLRTKATIEETEDGEGKDGENKGT